MLLRGGGKRQGEGEEGVLTEVWTATQVSWVDILDVPWRACEEIQYQNKNHQYLKKKTTVKEDSPGQADENTESKN